MNLADLLSGGYGALNGGGTNNLFGAGFGPQGGGGGTSNLFNNGGGQADGGLLSSLLATLQNQQQQGGAPTNAPLNGSAQLDMQRQGLFGAGANGAFGGGGSLFGNGGGSSFGGGGGLDSLQPRQGGMWTPQGWIPGSPWQTDTPSTPIFNSRPLAPVRPFGAVY